jgi:hypothetical protein
MREENNTMKDIEQIPLARDQELKDLCAIGVTWYISGNHRRRFRKGVEHRLMPHLTALHDAKRIATVLPLRHRPLKVPGKDSGNAWTDYWVIVLGPRVDPDEIWHSIKGSAQAEGIQRRLLRAEILRPQPNIDMFYPRIGGLQHEPRCHWIEYVVSRFETREEYCRDQYLFSGPVIRHFYETNAVGRCIGFERVRFLKNDGTLPEWDVIHITGFALVRLVQIAWNLWRYMPVFNTIARKVGHRSAFEVLRSWDAQRVKYQRLAVQDESYTLQPVHDAALVPESARDG